MAHEARSNHGSLSVSLEREDVSRAFRRRLVQVAAALALLPVLVESLALDPRAVLEIGEPVRVLPPLVLGSSLPYLAAALSCGALAWAWSSPPAAVAPRPRWHPAIVALSVVLAFGVAFSRPSIEEVLLAEPAHGVVGDELRIGGGGPFGLRVPLESMPLEEAGALAITRSRETAAVTRVVLYARREVDVPEPAAVELVGGGHRVDLSARIRALEPGATARVAVDLTHLPLGASMAIRVVGEGAAPVRFLHGPQRGERVGLALESGGGDASWFVDELDERRTVHSGQGLVVRGTHVDGGGYTVLVLSGERWARHDLRTLHQGGGFLELDVAGAEPPPWAVRVLGQGVESEGVPLGSFEREPLGGSRWRYRYPLDAIAWNGVPLDGVVGLALANVGPSGPFELRVERAEVGARDAWRSGVGLLAVSRLGSGTRRALLAVGPPRDTSVLVAHQTTFRALLAILAVVGGVGFLALLRALWLRPVATAAAFAAGPASVLALDALLPFFVVPRPEHTWIGLAALLAIGVALRSIAPSVPSAPSEVPATPAPTGRLFPQLDLLRTVAMVGIIGIHVTADPSGAAWEAWPASERIVPVLLRTAMAPFDIAIFIGASFFLLAHTLERSSASYSGIIGRRLERLLVPFAFWSLVYLAVRFLKAEHFGYAAGYRAELSDVSSWVRYALLGSAQYHLHFLPFLAGLTLLYPLARPGSRGPAVGLVALLVSLVAWYFLDRWIYQSDVQPALRPYALRATKTLGYLGYAALAFGVYRATRDGRFASRRGWWAFGALFALVCCAAVLWPHAAQEAASGTWLPMSLGPHLGRHVAMAAAFVLFLVVERVPWPRLWRRLGALTFGVYLFHPIVVDLLEIGQHGLAWSPTTRVLVNLIVATVVSFAAVGAIAQVRWLRWTIGLERGTA